MANLAAVVGVGQTKHKSKHKDVSMAGLVRQAAERALADAGCEWKDIDALDPPRSLPRTTCRAACTTACSP